MQLGARWSEAPAPQGEGRSVRGCRKAAYHLLWLGPLAPWPSVRRNPPQGTPPPKPKSSWPVHGGPGLCLCSLPFGSAFAHRGSRRESSGGLEDGLGPRSATEVKAMADGHSHLCVHGHKSVSCWSRKAAMVCKRMGMAESSKTSFTSEQTWPTGLALPHLVLSQLRTPTPAPLMTRAGVTVALGPTHLQPTEVWPLAHLRQQSSF